MPRIYIINKSTMMRQLMRVSEVDDAEDPESPIALNWRIHLKVRGLAIKVNCTFLN